VHVESGDVLVTSVEVIQELMHSYVSVDRLDTLDAALTLARGRMGTIWPVESADVDLARALVERHPGLGARDLLHVACCQRRGVGRVHTYDRALSAAMPG
jgi:hypothetical protein